MSDPPAIVIFTDVDGCILDAATYQPGPARAVIARLLRRGVTVVLCTSKTRSEIEALHAELGCRPIAIVESGAAVLIPPGALPVPLPGARRVRSGRLVPLAPPYVEVRAALAELKRALGDGVRGFGDMSVKEVAALTGLSGAAARRARRREFDEPFVHECGAERLARGLRAALPPLGMRWTRGGRFWHLHGDIDKGRAVRIVKGWIAGRGTVSRTIALGDSPHDLPMLREADEAVIIPRPDGTAHPVLRRSLAGARIAPAPGPEGWARAIAELLP